MKILRVHIENFRLLKEIDIVFATDKKRNLTVIRAANESGKTTLQTALQWGLFGDDALPKGGFRLSPLDASSGEKVRVGVSVEIDYQILKDGDILTYKLIRRVTETVRGGEYNKENPDLDLFKMTSKGADPVEVEYPESYIRQHLPKELREVFFTDGDRALNFIEGAGRDQMKRVEGAIRSLLGLEVIEKALDHVEDVISDINQKIKKGGSQSNLVEIIEELRKCKEDISKSEADLKSVREEKDNLKANAKDADDKIIQALRKGNRQDLERQRQDARKRRETAEEDARQAARDHSNLFKKEVLAKHFLIKPFKKAKTILDKLHERGEIPSQTIPVLEDRLNQPMCICGESLNADDSDGQKRRERIQRLIEASQNADEVRKKATALFYSAQDLLKPVEGSAWSGEYSEVFRRRGSAKKRAKESGQDESEADAKISQLPDIDIQTLQENKILWTEQAEEKRAKEARLEMTVQDLVVRVKKLEHDRDKLRKNDEISAELTVANDLQTIMNNALEVMKTKELERVSGRMNEIFLKMIGSDESERSTIKHAEITPEFKIIVLGLHDQELNPSQDLNGASRRALTIAFILALTEVSEVDAPNVIDTPLGMTSGFVKTAILQTAIQQSSQLILFLTHDEIKGCEDILDEYAGRIHTLTNPSHYPRILINDPEIEDTKILICECNHHNSCKICARRKTIDVESIADDAQQP